jgi:M6 family metalloprotease-like protein
MCPQSSTGVLKSALAFLLLIVPGASLFALEKPTPAEIAQYRLDGSLAQRIARAQALGNNRADRQLVSGFHDKVERVRLRMLGRLDADIDRVMPVLPSGIRPGLPNKGTNRIFALLIDFPDYPAKTAVATIDSKLYGDGDGAAFPYESLRNYYRRSSYGLLDIQGTTLGWYKPAYTRASMAQTGTARETLIREALTYFDAQGHDFSQYDNNGDGIIDYFCVFWTGPDNGWANFWWGYYTGWTSSFVLDGKRFNGARYSWQWEARGTSPFSPTTVMHETGHSLGLPDLYDYDATVGPAGGVGGLDMMDANYGDHNCFSKMLLDWITPRISTSGTGAYTLAPSATTPDALVVWPTYNTANPFTEFFMVQNRFRVNNDTNYPADGLIVWHIDAALNTSGSFFYDNSYTTHKLVRLMEADGAEHVESGKAATAADFYTAGKRFAPDSFPNSNAYSGAHTNVYVDAIALAGSNVTFNVSFAGYTLQIGVNTPSYGTTDPAPGSYSYGVGADVQVRALPAQFCSFRGWSGDASGRASPVTVNMSANRSVTAVFALVGAPANATGLRQTNRSVTQTEQIVDLRWAPSPANAGLNIVAYRIYRTDSAVWVKVADLTASQGFWRDRKVSKSPQWYGITCINDDGVESDKAVVAVK